MALLRNVRLEPEPRRLRGALWGHCWDGGVYLGRIRDAFSGTDALAMNAGPDAVQWAQSGAVPPMVVGEGARLGYSAFLGALARAARLTIVHLTAARPWLDKRCAARGSRQNESWRRAAETRAERAAQSVDAYNRIAINTGGLTPKQVLRIVAAALPREARERLRIECL
jgi:hypothetical protein